MNTLATMKRLFLLPNILVIVTDFFVAIQLRQPRAQFRFQDIRERLHRNAL